MSAQLDFLSYLTCPCCGHVGLRHHAHHEGGRVQYWLGCPDCVWEQPDSEGWWAFEGETPNERSVTIIVETFWADDLRGGDDMVLTVEIDGSEFSVGEMTGRWWRLTMPWEAQP